MEEKSQTEKIPMMFTLPPIPKSSSICAFIFIIYFLAMPSGMWDLSSPTRDQTHAPSIGSSES